jgi:hypothetical protein
MNVKLTNNDQPENSGRHLKEDEQGQIYLHVAHDVAEQELQFAEEDFTRLLPPPIPKAEISLWISLLPHSTQTTFFSPPIGVSVSKQLPHASQANS